MEQLKNFLERYVSLPDDSLPDDQFTLLESVVKEIKLDAGDYFLREGNICRTIGFVMQGTLRVLHFDQDGEVTRYFIRQGHIAVLPDSFRHQSPANENIQAVTDCQLLILRYEDLMNIHDKIPYWLRLVQKLLEEVTQQRQLGRTLNSFDIKSRLLLFDEEYPGLGTEIPVKILASFLRLSPLELIKLRSELA